MSKSMPAAYFTQGLFFVITTEADMLNAYKLSNNLIKKKLIACVSFNNIQSHFWWEGEIHESKEVQLIMKCKKENINRVHQDILKSHSYEIPEIVYFPVSSDNLYYKWVSSI